MTLFSDCCESLRCMVTGWTSGISTWMRLWVKTSPRMTRCNTLFFGCLFGRSWGARSRWSLLTASSLARRLRKGRCSSLLTPQCLPRTSWTSTEADSRLSIFTAMQRSLPGSPIASHGRGNHWTLRSTCHSPLSTWRVFPRNCGMNLSVSNVKTLLHNADMIQRFIRMSGKRPHRLLNTNDFKELLYYGVSDAAWLFNFQRTIVIRL